MTDPTTETYAEKLRRLIAARSNGDGKPAKGYAANVAHLQRELQRLTTQPSPQEPSQ